MKFGIALASNTDSWKWAVKAEELGFNSVWFYDSQLIYSDIFISMALAAEHTKRVRLGTGVMVPSNRIAPVAANSLATLNKMAPGRIDFGVGTGNTARRTMGRGAIKLANTRAYIEQVSGLLKGETVTFDFEGIDKKIAFLNPDMDMINIDDEVAVWFSATGPKSRKMTAEMGTNWLNFGAMEGAVESLQNMQESWVEAGRNIEDMGSQMFFLGAVLKGDDEAADNQRLLDQGGPATAVLFRTMADMAGKITDMGPDDEISNGFRQYKDVHAKYEPEDARYIKNHRGHMIMVRPDEGHITPSLVRQTTISGTEEELVKNLSILRDAGYDQLNVQLVPGHEHVIEDWARVFRQVGTLEN